MSRLLGSYIFCFIFIISSFSSCGNSEGPNNKVEYGQKPEISQITGVRKSEVIQDRENFRVDVDPFKLPLVSKVTGVHLKAIAIAFDAFKVDSMIPEDKKNIENYDIELRQNKDNFYLYFAPHSTEKDRKKLQEGGESSLGKSVMFIIERRSFEIKKRYFFM